MSCKEVIQDRFKKWSSKPPFPKRKREFNVMETLNRNREPPPTIPLGKAKIEALVRALIEDGEIKLRPIG